MGLNESCVPSFAQLKLYHRFKPECTVLKLPAYFGKVFQKVYLVSLYGFFPVGAGFGADKAFIKMVNVIKIFKSFTHI